MSDGLPERREDGDGDADTDTWCDHLGRDLTALILSKLPLRSMLRASAVRKAWHAALRESRPSRRGRPWLFLHGRDSGVTTGTGHNHNTFAYDPDEPSSWVSFTLPPGCIAGAGGFAFTAPSLSRLAFAPLLREGDDVDAWRHPPPLSSTRCNPIVAAAAPSGPGSERLLFLVVGGGGFPGGLIDVEDSLPTELYEYDRHGDHGAAAAGAWQQGAPLPEEFGTGSGSSSLLLSSAMVGDRFLFVCGIYSCTVSAFDLSRRAWTAPRKLCPFPGLVAAFLATGRQGQRLLLAGVEEGRCALGVWDVEPHTLASRKIGEMPADMAAWMLPATASIRCVGQDGLLYVLSEEQHRGYPACVCEVIVDGEELACRWSKLPPLPVSARSRFRRMMAFCSPVLQHQQLQH